MGSTSKQSPAEFTVRLKVISSLSFLHLFFYPRPLMWHLFSALHLSLALLSSLQEPPLLLWCSFSCATFSPASSFLLYVAPQTCFFRAGLPLLILASVPSNFRNCAVCILLYGVSFFTWLFRWDFPPPLSFVLRKAGGLCVKVQLLK